MSIFWLRVFVNVCPWSTLKLSNYSLKMSKFSMHWRKEVLLRNCAYHLRRFVIIVDSSNMVFVWTSRTSTTFRKNVFLHGSLTMTRLSGWAQIVLWYQLNVGKTQEGSWIMLPFKKILWSCTLEYGFPFLILTIREYEFEYGLWWIGSRWRWLWWRKRGHFGPFT